MTQLPCGNATSQPSVTARRGVEVRSVARAILLYVSGQVMADAAGLEGSRRLKILEFQKYSASTI